MENLIGDEIDTIGEIATENLMRSSITTARLKRAPDERWAMSPGSVKRLHPALISAGKPACRG
jgi:hypothetical protein